VIPRGTKAPCHAYNDREGIGKIEENTAAMGKSLEEIETGIGGARKRRFAGRGKGKSGGYRVISYYAGDDERPENCYCSALPKGSGPCLACYTRWLAGRRA
jgi:hypothetical protein